MTCPRSIPRKAASASHFRFLELPQELQDQVFRFHLQDARLTIYDWRHDEATDDTYLEFRRLPDLALEMTCKAICIGSKRVRSKIWPRELNIDSLDHLNDIFFVLTEHPRYKWVRQHMEVLHLKTWEDPCIMESSWLWLGHFCPRLKHLKLQILTEDTLSSFHAVSNSHNLATSVLTSEVFISNLSISCVAPLLAMLSERLQRDISMDVNIVRRFMLEGRFSAGCRQAFTQVCHNQSSVKQTKELQY